MRITILALGYASCCLAFAQPATVNIDLKKLLGGGTLNPPQTVGEKVQAESDALAASSNARLNEARSHYLRYQIETKNEQNARTRALVARRRQSDLGLEKDRALDEMRHGLYCSGCWQTRSEILAKGEPFPHPGQQIVVGGANPQQIAAKAQEFDQKINSAKAEQYRATQEAEAAVQAKTEAAEQMINSFIPWKLAMLAEDDGRAKAWDAAVANYKERFDSYGKELLSLDRAIARAKAVELRTQTIQDLLAQKEEIQARLRIMVNEAELDYFRRRQQEVLFEERLQSGRSQLESFVSEVGGPPLDVISSFASVAVPPLPGGSVKLPGTPFFIKTGAPNLNVSGPGLFKASLRFSEDWLRNKLNVDLVAGIDTPFGPIEGGVRRTTEWGPNGVTITDTPIGKVPEEFSQKNINATKDMLTGKVLETPTTPDFLDLLKDKKESK